MLVSISYLCNHIITSIQIDLFISSGAIFEFIFIMICYRLACTQVVMMAQVLMEVVFDSLSSFQSSVQGTAHLLSKKSLELQSMAKFTIWGIFALFLSPQPFGNYCLRFSCVQ
jgi:hypothetical protein